MTSQHEKRYLLETCIPRRIFQSARGYGALIGAVILALALLATRFALVHSDHVSQLHSTVKSEKVHHNKQCVEARGLDWIVPSARHITPVALFIFLAPRKDLGPHLRFLRGPHFNRPPPFALIQRKALTAKG